MSGGQGRQARPDLLRPFLCSSCLQAWVQLGPGRGRRFCPKKRCQLAAKRARRIPLSLAEGIP